ncbi:unnamed protein product [Lactuca saligna]|uniref:FH2 domain-containing protein n=1 Tax=Lactuca saligna TaxID=75948 RepID=A0AA35VHA7_LACSI|nr:unnamed protein product [Lactuca saligna]
MKLLPANNMRLLGHQIPARVVVNAINASGEKQTNKHRFDEESGVNMSFIRQHNRSHHQTLNEFISIAESKVGLVTNLYFVVDKNVDALALYFGEDPARCPFEQVIERLVKFVRVFRKAHEENCKQDEMEKKKAQKEFEWRFSNGVNRLNWKGRKM